MSFYALVNPLTGETLRVLRGYPDPVPAGLVVVELPAPWDDVSWLDGWKSLHGAGGGNGATYLDRDEPKAPEQPKPGGSPMVNAEQFFLRLEQAVSRAEKGNRAMSLLLFDLAQPDRAAAREFVTEMLQARGQELLPCDTLARVRPHLVAVILPDVDASGAPILPHRGNVTTLTYPADRDAIEAVRTRRHPLLHRSAYGRTPAA